MLRVSFSSTTAARAAVHVLEAYGYSAKPFGCDIVSDCPTLLAVPAIQKRVGFAEVERLDLSGGANSIGSPIAFPPAPSATWPSRAARLGLTRSTSAALTPARW